MSNCYWITGSLIWVIGKWVSSSQWLSLPFGAIFTLYHSLYHHHFKITHSWKRFHTEAYNPGVRVSHVLRYSEWWSKKTLHKMQLVKICLIHFHTLKLTQSKFIALSIFLWKGLNIFLNPVHKVHAAVDFSSPFQADQ